MISIELARQLRDAGVRWTPRSGDRFIVADRDMDDDVFTVSEMTIGVQRVETDEVLAFNGTTEWALDSVSIRSALWLPSEAQLRELLGGAFRALRPHGPEWTVEFELSGADRTVTATQAADAYGQALLDLARHAAD